MFVNDKQESIGTLEDRLSSKPCEDILNSHQTYLNQKEQLWPFIFMK